MTYPCLTPTNNTPKHTKTPLTPTHTHTYYSEGLIEDFAVDFNRLRLAPLTAGAALAAQSQKKTVSQTFEGKQIVDVLVS